MSTSAPLWVHTDRQVAATRAWADHYRLLGLCVIPSRPDAKRPLVKWKAAAQQGRPVPKSLFERFPTANAQVACGRAWGLVAVDLDGPEAIEHWRANYGAHAPRTWITHSGGDGRHLWFAVPAEGDPIRSGRLWGEWDPAGGPKGTGDWCPRRNIELLADGKLLMAPPSVHPRTGRTYRFVAGTSPRELHRPAPAPAWLLAMPRLASPARATTRVPPVASPRRPLACPPGDSYDRRAVLATIGDRVALAKSWGLRLAGSRPNQDGWIPCHRIDSEDRNPSAAFHVGGWYWDHTLPRKLGLFDLAVAMGVYPDWKAAVNDLGATYGAPKGIPA